MARGRARPLGWGRHYYWSVRTGDYRYTEYVTGEKELYDYAADPYELANMADDPAYKDIQADLKGRLESLVAEAEAPSRGADGKMKPAAPDLSPNDGRISADDAGD
jgi:arylsulfatase A-like enzyme